jgi:hypothetical protein
LSLPARLEITGGSGVTKRGNAVWNERTAAAGLFMGAITCIIGTGLTSFRAGLLPGIIMVLLGLLVALASWLVYRL